MQRLIKHFIFFAAGMCGLARCGLSQDFRFEAEDALLSGTQVSNSTLGFSGTGYVSDFNNSTDYVQFNVTVPAGMYELDVGYNSPFGQKGYTIQVNNEINERMFDGTGSQFATSRAGYYELQPGTSTIRITDDWGFYNIDYVDLKPAAPAPPAPIAPILSDSQATPSTQYLMNYLTSIYGNKTL